MSVRERLAQLLLESGITQAELARRVGEHITWVNNRLRGAAGIKADDIPRLARALGVPPAAFFEEPVSVRSREGETAKDAGVSYADVFTRELAKVWQEEMTESEREFVEAMVRSTRRYRERVRQEARARE